MNLETDTSLLQVVKTSPEVNVLLGQLDKSTITGVALPELKIREIFYGTKKTIGIKELFQDGFEKSNEGYLNGDFEDAYALAMALYEKDNTPDYIKREIEEFQGMVTK